MDDSALVIGLATLVVLGVGAQWIGRRLGFPSLLLLLPAGVLAGEADLVDPTELFGDLLFPLVTMLVALLLFQSSLNLRLDDLPRDARGPVARLVTVGVAVTFGGAVAALLLATDVPRQVAYVLGGILTVSGPTVVGPLLRVIRPDGRTRAVLAWEGTVLDPVGATLGVVMLNLVIAGADESDVHPVLQMLGRLGLGIAVGLAGAALLVFVMSRFLVTDDMEAAVGVLFAVAAYGAAEVLLSEAGLFATVTLGVVAANQRLVPIARINGFGETLEVLIIGILFILLGALVPVRAVVDNLVPIVVVVALLVLVVRPLAVGISQIGVSLSLRERGLVAAMDPRGIVAAATAAQFTPSLADVGIDSELMLPIVFGVILGTGVVYGLGAPLVASVLGLRARRATGVVLVGERPWVLGLGRCLQELGVPVLLLLGRPVALGEQDGALEVVSVVEADEELRSQLDGRALAKAVVATEHAAIVTLVVAELVEQLGRSRVYVVPRREEGAVERLLYEAWTPQPFAEGVTVADLDRRADAGAQVRICRDGLPEGAVPLAVVREDDSVDLRPGTRRRPTAGTLIALVPSGA